VSRQPLGRPIRAAVVTLSDKASAGLRADASGPQLCDLLRGIGALAADAVVIPDDQDVIEKTLSSLADSGVTKLQNSLRSMCK
jgi:molybdopterin biosynthesis enzyme MoaB